MIVTVLHKTNLLYTLMIAGLLLVLKGCAGNEQPETPDSRALMVPHLRFDSLYQVFVETPAGDMLTLSYNAKTNQMDTLAAQEGGLRKDYLPYPVNSCFFPVMQNDSLTKIPAWLIAARLTTGDTLAVKMLGVIEYREKAVLRRECLVVPADPVLQTINVERFKDFIIQYDDIKFMFETWLKNRHGLGQVSQINWNDEEYATKYLEFMSNE